MATKKNDVELLPEDSDNNDIDISNLRVNFSEKEADSEALDFTPVPTGTYHVAITGIEVRKSTSEKNPGKPYWAVEMTCQSGPYENRKFWGNVMLWEGAAYSLAQLLKATGHGDAVKTGKIPSGEELMGEQLVISVVKTLDKYRMEREESNDKLFKNEVKGYKPLAGASVGGGSGSDSLMP